MNFKLTHHLFVEFIQKFDTSKRGELFAAAQYIFDSGQHHQFHFLKIPSIAKDAEANR